MTSGRTITRFTNGAKNYQNAYETLQRLETLRRLSLNFDQSFDPNKLKIIDYSFANSTGQLKKIEWTYDGIRINVKSCKHPELRSIKDSIKQADFIEQKFQKKLFEQIAKKRYKILVKKLQNTWFRKQAGTGDVHTKAHELCAKTENSFIKAAQKFNAMPTKFKQQFINLKSTINTFPRAAELLYTKNLYLKAIAPIALTIHGIISTSRKTNQSEPDQSS